MGSTTLVSLLALGLIFGGGSVALAQDSTPLQFEPVAEAEEAITTRDKSVETTDLSAAQDDAATESLTSSEVTVVTFVPPQWDAQTCTVSVPVEPDLFYRDLRKPPGTAFPQGTSEVILPGETIGIVVYPSSGGDRVLSTGNTSETLNFACAEDSTRPLVTSGITEDGRGLYFIARDAPTDGWGLYIYGPKDGLEDQLIVENFPIERDVRHEFPVSESGWYSLSMVHPEQGSVYAGEFAIDIEASWTPASTLQYIPIGCSVAGERVETIFDYGEVSGERLREVYINGQQVVGGELIGTGWAFAPGSYDYYYTIENAETGEIATVDGGTFTVLLCDEPVDPTPVTPLAPTQDGNTVTIPSQDGVVYVDENGVILIGTVSISEGGLTVTAQPSDDSTVFPDDAVTEWFFAYQASAEPPVVPGPGVTPTPSPTASPAPGTTGEEQLVASSSDEASGLKELAATGLNDSSTWMLGGAGTLLVALGVLLYRRTRTTT